jgi:hypothetical protein
MTKPQTSLAPKPIIDLRRSSSDPAAGNTINKQLNKQPMRANNPNQAFDYGTKTPEARHTVRERQSQPISDHDTTNPARQSQNKLERDRQN